MAYSVLLLTLTEALEAYQAAQAEEAGFLKGLASNDTFLGAFDETDVDDKAILDRIAEDETADAGDIAVAVENAAEALDTAVGAVAPGVTVFVDPTAPSPVLVGENTLAGIIADTKAAAAQAVTAAQTALATAQAELTSAQKAGLTNLENRLNAAVAAETAVDATETELARQAGIAEANLVAVDVTDPITDLAALNAVSGVWELTADGKNLTAAQQALLKPYIDAGNANVSAQATAVTAYEALNAALVRIGETTGITVSGTTTLADFETAGFIAKVLDAAGDVVGYTIDDTGLTDSDIADVVDARNDLADVLQEQTNLLDAVADFETINEIDAAYDELNAATIAAEEAITNSEEDGGLGVNMTVIDGAAAANFDAVDLFVFADNDGVLSFLEAGDLVFFGTEYTFVELAAGVDFEATRQGSADVLEIFYQVQGANTVFYVEDNAEAGRDLNLDGIATVELVGVSGELDIDAGFVGLVA